MINPKGEDFSQVKPMGGPATNMPGSTTGSGMATGHGSYAGTDYQTQTEQQMSAGSRVSAVASDAWRQTRERAGVAREKTEFFLRENPVPTVIGALAVGLAIGLAIRYSQQEERETEVKTPLGDINLGVLSLPFLWPFFRSVKRRYEDTAEVVKDRVERVRDVDVDRYVKPLRKKWRNWTN